MRNPINIVDDLLADYASPKVRRIVHTVLTLAVLLVTLYFAADGDWEKFVISLAATAYTAANRANTNPEPEPVEYVGVVSGNPVLSPDEPESPEDEGLG